MSGGSDKPAPVQTTSYSMSPEERQLYQLAMPGITSFAASVPERYQSSTIAPFNPYQVQGQNLALQAATSQQPLAQQGATFSGGVLSGSPDAMRDETIRAVTRPIYENLTESVLPAIRTGAQNAGQFGGSREGIAQTGAIREADRAAADAAAKVSTGIYDTDVRRQMQTLGLLPQTLQGLVAPATTTSGVGDVQRAMEQALLGEQVGNFNLDQYAPFLQSRDILGLMGFAPKGTTTATGSVPTGPSSGQQALGGALGGASLGASLGSVVPGIGTLAGAGIGAGAGALIPFLFR